VAEEEAQGIREVKKLSKQSDNAADHAQMKRTSDSVCANLADVRQRPKGRPKYSSLDTINNESQVFWDNVHKLLPLHAPRSAGQK